MDKKLFDLSLRALLYEEGGRCCARCLEMDLIGVGKNEKEALRHLQDTIEAHISFAVFKNDDSLIMFPADAEYFERWEKANRFRLHNELFPDRAMEINGKAAFISMTKEEIAKLKKSHRFSEPETALA